MWTEGLNMCFFHLIKINLVLQVSWLKDRTSKHLVELSLFCINHSKPTIVIRSWSIDQKSLNLKYHFDISPTVSHSYGVLTFWNSIIRLPSQAFQLRFENDKLDSCPARQKLRYWLIDGFVKQLTNFYNRNNVYW